MENRSMIEFFEVRSDETCQGLGVFALVPLLPGDRLGFFSGTPTLVRSRMSLQFGRDLFIEPGPEDPLRNLNHSCDPSAHFIGRELFAMRALAPGDAITLDYNLHEEEMASPFECRCGSVRCVRRVSGWRFLSESEKAVRIERAGAWLGVHPKS